MKVLTDEIRSAMIVDDSADISEVLTIWLTARGYKVRSFARREDALLILQKEKFSILLLDYIMEGMTAETFIPIVRKLQPNLPIILITAHPNAFELSSRLGVSYVIQKPFDDAFLGAVTDRLVAAQDGKRERDFNRSYYGPAKI